MLFDRIWIPWSLAPHSPISDKESFCDYETDMEVLGRQLGQRTNELRSIGRKTEPNVDKMARGELFKSGLRRSIRYVAELYSKKGYNVIPLYGISEQFQAEFTPGLQIAYEASFREISIVSPEPLTVEHVFDFREDAEAVRQYRSLHLWLHDGLKAESVEQATAIIFQKLEAYEWAIKKHGLKTVTGALSAILDSEALIAIAGGVSLAALLSGPIWAALVGGLLVCSQSIVWVAKRQIDLEDTKRGQNSEVALFYTMKRVFTK